MKHKLIQLISVIIIAVFAWHLISIEGQVKGSEWRHFAVQNGNRYKDVLRPRAAGENGRVARSRMAPDQNSSTADSPLGPADTGRASSPGKEPTGEIVLQNGVEEMVFATAVIKDVRSSKEKSMGSWAMEVRDHDLHGIEKVFAAMRPMVGWERLLKKPSHECERLLAVLKDTPDHVAPSWRGISKLANDRILRERIDTVRRLGNLGCAAEAAIPELVRLLYLGNHAVSCIVPQALCAIDPQGHKTVPFLILHGFGTDHITTLTVPSYVAQALVGVAIRNPHWAIPVYAYVAQGKSLIVRDLEPKRRDHIRQYMLDVLSRLYRRLPQAHSVILSVLRHCEEDNNPKIRDEARRQLRNITSSGDRTHNSGDMADVSTGASPESAALPIQNEAERQLQHAI
ncbi:MAG: hypothetical protein HY589_04320 [Candidatus Omnitrophica bacterium]|nr:hypothetical protein [Candidatus Omnitrophota bacterium]